MMMMPTMTILLAPPPSSSAGSGWPTGGAGSVTTGCAAVGCAPGVVMSAPPLAAESVIA